MYTGIKVKLIGEDGNIFNLIGICCQALRRHKKYDLIDKFYQDINHSKDYTEALGKIATWFDVE